ncbi:sugar ABC transporter ATP-binding protein [Microbispora sp. SCL1-1]|uniref:sugar ABC transporter ATP-binding protein n=1 Tax=unclassified Microbispora TaxID=2614687 RepID=UPI00115A2F24|nr:MULTISPECIES: sugar ABC transporter ATP-binding protein [unclassified Microbispora]NJP26708.1 sugar ABC transporter ATP-binding protein [Microbispora sp. CL1-1]TQS11917.1 sugar ABC transporter ATP-binding protein [Microbispora sp. SCL1-1]
MSNTDVVAEVRAGTKRYPGVTALSDVDFAVRRGEVRALLGKNGAGKSTLIKVLSGAEHLDSGEALVRGTSLAGLGTRDVAALGVATVYQELSLVPEMTVAENLFLGAWPRSRGALDLRRMRADAKEAMARIGVDIDVDSPVGTLGSAGQQLVEIARAVAQRPTLLILDEPTSSLAAAEVRQVIDVVRTVAEQGVAVIYVSHRMDEIRQVADTATVVRDGRIVETLPVRTASTHEIVAMMLGAAPEAVAGRTRRPSAEPPVLSARGLVSDRLNGLDIDVRPGEILGIAGVLGSGRTETLRALVGLDRPASGEIRLRGEPVRPGAFAAMLAKGLGMTPENRRREGIVPLMGVDENIVISDLRKVSRSGVLDRRAIRQAARALIDRLAIKTARPGTPIGTLSGGNQQKAVLARWLHAGSDVLLLDEPTRGVDVEAKRQIYDQMRLLADDGRAVVFVSSEVEELADVCDRIVVLRGGRAVAELSGDEIELNRVMALAIAEE